MAIVGDIGVKLWANVRDFVGGIKTAENKLKEFKSVLGKRAFLGEVGEILQGGGAVAGATFLAKTIGESAEKARQLHRAFRDGSLTFKELAGDTLRALPVLGQFVTMWDNIGSAIRGTKSAVEELAEAQSALDLATKRDQLLSTAKRRLSLANAGDDVAERGRLEARFQREDSLAEINRVGLGGGGLRLAMAAVEAEFENRMSAIATAQRRPIAEMLTGLQDELAQLRLTGAEWRERQAFLAGATSQERQYIAETHRAIEAEKSRQESIRSSRAEMEAFAKSVIEDTRTPIENFTRQMLRLRAALFEGLIDANAFDAAERRAADLLRGGAFETPTRTSAQFQQINPATFSFAALRQLNQPQTVNDPQIQQTNRLLGSIDRKVGTQVALTS